MERGGYGDDCPDLRLWEKESRLSGESATAALTAAGYFGEIWPGVP